MIPESRACYETARSAALRAWEEVSHLFQGSFKVFEKPGESPATEADIAADRIILETLKGTFPEEKYGYLSEETEHGTDRLTKDYCWIIDPIDGTREFIEGRDDFAVQIGLVDRSNDDGQYRPLFGLVYEPRAGKLFHAYRGEGAWVEDPSANSSGKRQVHVSETVDLEALRLIVTRQGYGHRLGAVIERLPTAEICRRGSFGVKTMAVAAGEADVYLHTARRQSKEWDTCGPHAILLEAGGILTDVTGGEITYNKEDYFVERGALACNPALHEVLLGELARVTELADYFGAP